MTKRFADAQWNGNLREGEGNMRLGTGMFEGSYTYKSRFEEGVGTNPEELIAAALAGCFSMALSGDLTKAGFAPEQIKTHAELTMERVDNRPTILEIHLNTEAKVRGIEDKQFQEIAEGSRKNCPVSRALGNVNVSLDAKLVK